MNKKVRKVLILILTLIFVASLGMLLQQMQKYRAGEEIYEQAVQTAKESSAKPEAAQPEPAEEELPDVYGEVLKEIDLTALQAVNGDVIGWIYIPDTVLSYPLVQGADNSYYLNHAWNGQVTSVGSVFMDCHCAADFTDFNTIIYGHRMINGSMFGSLKHYNKPSYRDAHPYIYIKEQRRTHCYEIFAAYEAPVQSQTYGLKIQDDADKQAVIDFALEQSVIDTGIVPETTDQILTMSTCTGKGYDTRWVVQAVEVRPEG